MASFLALHRRRAGLRAGRREPSNGRTERRPRRASASSRGPRQGFATTRSTRCSNWAKKYSLFQYPFVTACCGMEFMAIASPRFDMARFGAEAPRFSPRQADLLWVVGTISQRQAPVLKRIYEQMAEPKWVLAFGTCASCGGFYDNYTTRRGHRQDHPLRHLRARLSAAARGGDRRPHAPAGQDRARRPHARHRQAAHRSGHDGSAGTPAARPTLVRSREAGATHEQEGPRAARGASSARAILETHAQFGDDTAVVDAGALARGRALPARRPAPAR